MASGSGFRRANPAQIAPVFRRLLISEYGRWECSAGTAYSPDAWFHLLFDATLAEATSIEHMVELSRFAFAQRIDRFTPGAREALEEEHAPTVLRHVALTVVSDSLATSERANAYLREVRHHFRDTMGLRGKQVMFPLRAALVGSLEGPCLGTVTSLLGENRCNQRLMDVLTCSQDTV